MQEWCEQIYTGGVDLKHNQYFQGKDVNIQRNLKRYKVLELKLFPVFRYITLKVSLTEFT